MSNNITERTEGLSPFNLKVSHILSDSFPSQALEVVSDVTKEDDAKRIVESTVCAFGRIDILVNNAGGALPTSILDPNCLQNYENVMNLDLRSVIYLTSIAVPYLEKTNGNVINISSIVALKPVFKLPVI